MGKSAVLSVDIATMLSNIQLKKQLLLFDKLYIDTTSLYNSRMLNENEGYVLSKREQYLKNEKALFYLERLGLVELRDFPYEPEAIYESGEVYPTTGDKQSRYVYDIIAGQVCRSKKLAAQLQAEGVEAYPLYQVTFQPARNNNKGDILRFVLKKIPEPHADVPWEQILEFRSDGDTMRKYYALIQWINAAARKNIMAVEVEEEYSYLFHDYAEQFRLHKMKHTHGVVEVIVQSYLDFFLGILTGHSFSTAFFSLFRHDLAFKEAEQKFTGREIAYIHKALETFEK